MLVEFALCVSCGLAAAMLLAPWKEIPPGFFRTHCLVMLGLLVLAAFCASDRTTRILVATAAVLAYGGSIGWGLGLPRVGAAAAWGVAIVAGAILIGPSWDRSPLLGLARLASAFLLGATLTAMLLGHYYLTAPAMSIGPLLRFVRCLAVALPARAALALPGLVAWWSDRLPSEADRAGVPLFLAMRWGMGIVAASLAAVLAWRTAAIRSTQSATGILYIAMTLVLFGELTALVLTRQTGVVF